MLLWNRNEHQRKVDQANGKVDGTATVNMSAPKGREVYAMSFRCWPFNGQISAGELSSRSPWGCFSAFPI